MPGAKRLSQNSYGKSRILVVRHHHIFWIQTSGVWPNLKSVAGGDKDRWIFIETFGKACEKTGWLVDAWVLMTNHYHLVLRTPQATPNTASILSMTQFVAWARRRKAGKQD